jgi:hypothetical protein
VAALAARTIAEQVALMRLWRMNQIPGFVVMLRLIQRTMCSKFAASRQHEKFPSNQTFAAKIGSRSGTEIYQETTRTPEF